MAFVGKEILQLEASQTSSNYLQNNLSNTGADLLLLKNLARAWLILPLKFQGEKSNGWVRA